MKEILRRALTGAVFITLLLSAIFLNSDAFDFLLMIFGLACIYEYKRMVGLRGYYIFIAYLILWWIFIYLIKENDIVPINILMGVTIVTDAALKWEGVQYIQKICSRTFLYWRGVYFLNYDTL